MRSRFFGVLVAVVLGFIGLTGCSPVEDPADFSADITAGDSGLVLANEDFALQADLLVPEGFSRPLKLSLERRAVGDSWILIYEELISEGGYGFAALDRLVEGATAEYRLSAFIPGETDAFFTGEAHRIRSIDGTEFLTAFFTPFLEVKFPDNVTENMLIPGDIVEFEWGYDSDIEGQVVEARLVSNFLDDIVLYDSDVSSESSLRNAFTFEEKFNSLTSDTIFYEFAVELVIRSGDQEHTLLSDYATFLTHSLGLTIVNYLDATNSTCLIEGFRCLDALIEYGGVFVDPASNSWLETEAYYLSFQNYIDFGIDYQFELKPNSLKPISDPITLTACRDTPLEVSSGPLDRFVAFEVSATNNENVQLLGHLAYDGSTHNFSFSPIECAEFAK